MSRLHLACLLGWPLLLALPAGRMPLAAGDPPEGGSPTFGLVVLPGLAACGGFRDGRPIRAEYEARCRLRLRAGRWDLPAGVDTVPADLVESVEFGPDARPATPVTGGLLRVHREPSQFCSPGVVCYRFAFEQDWEIDGEPLRLRDHRGLQFFAVNGAPHPFRDMVIDERRISPLIAPQEAFLSGQVGDDPGDYSRSIRFSSCHDRDLSLWAISLELEGGWRALLHHRFHDYFAGSGEVQFVRGEVWLGEAHAVQTSYWKLVYSALHHNWDEHYWVLFPSPATIGGTSGARGLLFKEEFSGSPRRAALLGAGLEEVRPLAVLRYEKVQVDELPQGPFVRGDAGDDGRVNIGDAVAVLGHLYLGEPGELACPDAADIDDGGSLQLTDAIALLSFLFLGGEAPPEPHPECGEDPSGDTLLSCGGSC